MTIGGTAIIAVALPWVLLLLYTAYYYVFKRPQKVSANMIAPFHHFMDCLTDGASPGYDKNILRLFHPEMLDNVVERGVLRAMMRSLCDNFGKIVSIPHDTALVRTDGDQVNVVALVDFQGARQVKCQVLWTWRSQTCKIPTRHGMLQSYYVKGFHIEPRPADRLDLLNYIQSSDFVPFAERFVERLFERPPVRAVEMMVPALRERYSASLAPFEEGIRRVVDVCGGLGNAPGSPSEVDATLVSERIVYAGHGDKEEGGERKSAEEEEGEGSKMEVREMEMIFSVQGVRRAIEVSVGITIVELHCFVVRYKVCAKPDTSKQVVLDYDTGERTIVA